MDKELIHYRALAHTIDQYSVLIDKTTLGATIAGRLLTCLHLPTEMERLSRVLTKDVADRMVTCYNNYIFQHS